MITHITKRIINWFNLRTRAELRPDHIFWQSLLVIHRQYFEEVLLDYVQTGRSPEHIYNQFSTIGCWLDLVIENGSMDNK